MRFKAGKPSELPIALFAAILFLLVALVSANPAPAAAPAAAAFPAPSPNPNPEAQTYNTYAPFSGAIYIVGAGGSQFSAALPAPCPISGYQGCVGIGVYSCCCPAGNSCSMLTNGVVGCCPAGSACSGTVNQAQITTITVTTTATVQAGPQTQTVVQQPAIGGPVFAVGSTRTSQGSIVYDGYCSTLYMHGMPLPTTGHGACGTILILNRGAALRPDWSGWSVLVAVYVVLGTGAALGLWRR